MSRELIQTERELLDYIDLPEVEPGSLKFIFNEQKKQIDWECIFATCDGWVICKKIANLLKDHGNIPIDSQYGSGLDQYQ